MAKPLRELRKQFSRQGLHLLFSFDTSIEPGLIVHIPRPRDVNHLGSIFKFPGIADTEVVGPADLGLMDFTRTHELTLGGVAELLQSPKLGGKLKKVKSVRLSLDNPQKWYIGDKIELFSILSRDLGWPDSAYAKTLARRKHYLITEIVKTKLKFTFEGTGNVALDADASGLKNLKSLKLNTDYKWENHYELASKKPLVVAYEAVRWIPGKGIFRTLKVS
jgi:hypothetical protein